jgi:hypothetical protein
VPIDSWPVTRTAEPHLAAPGVLAYIALQHLMKQYLRARALLVLLALATSLAGCVAVGGPGAGAPGATPLSVEQAIPGLCRHLDLGCGDALQTPLMVPAAR